MTRRGRRATRVALICVAAVCPRVAAAQLVEPPPLYQPTGDSSADVWARPALTGDWGGLRTSIQNAGVTLRGHFTTESAANPSGGRKQTARYTQQLDFGADFDLD